MDFRDNLHAGASHSAVDASPLQHEANSSRFTLTGALNEIPAPIIEGAGAVAGIAARLSGEIGIAGKIAAAGIGAAVIGDVALRAFSSTTRDNSSAYARDAFTLGALSAGIFVGPKLFSTEASAGKAFTRDLVEQKLILAGPGFGRSVTPIKATDNVLNAVANGGEGSNVVRLRDFMKGSNSGVKRVIEEADIQKFAPAKQAEIRETIATMVKNGHEPEFLMLNRDGRVLIDREAIEMAADAGFKKP